MCVFAHCFFCKWHFKILGDKLLCVAQFSELFQNKRAENWSQALGTSASLSASWNAMTDQMMALWEARIRQ